MRSRSLIQLSDAETQAIIDVLCKYKGCTNVTDKRLMGKRTHTKTTGVPAQEKVIESGSRYRDNGGLICTSGMSQMAWVHRVCIYFI